MVNGVQPVMGTGSRDFLPLYFPSADLGFPHFHFHYLSNTSRITAFLAP
jgi:hypothetical protein